MTSASVLEDLMVFNMKKSHEKSDRLRSTFANVCNSVNVASREEKGNSFEGILTT